MHSKGSKIGGVICAVLLVFFSAIKPAYCLDKTAVIAVIKSRNIAPYNAALAGLEKMVKDHAIDARMVVYELDGKKDLASGMIEQIRSAKADVVVTIGSLATEVAQQQIKDVPIVFCMILNPQASGFVKSMDSSGNNLTGASLDISIKQQFDNMQQLVPNLKRIGVVYNPQESALVVDQAVVVARGMGLELITKTVDSAQEVPAAIEELSKKIDALWEVADSTVLSPQSTQFIILHTLRNKIPFMGLSSVYVKAGALLALSSDEEDIGRQAGEQVIEILAGKKPRDLPVSTPRKVTLALNIRVAQQIGITVPASIMNSAKEVFR